MVWAGVVENDDDDDDVTKVFMEKPDQAANDEFSCNEREGTNTTVYSIQLTPALSFFKGPSEVCC